MNRGLTIIRGSPQSETKKVSIETEIAIPNLAALSIWAFSGGAVLVFFLSGRLFNFLVPALALALALSFLVIYSLWRSALRRWKIFLFCLGMGGLICAGFFFWYSYMAIWYDLAVSVGLGYFIGASPTIYFHIRNTMQPSWPAPYFWAEPEAEQSPFKMLAQPSIEDQTGQIGGEIKRIA